MVKCLIVFFTRCRKLITFPKILKHIGNLFLCCLCVMPIAFELD